MLALVLTQFGLFFAGVKIKAQVAAFAISIILCILTVISIFFVYLLLGFHVFLSVTNTTTNEFCKSTWDSVAGNSHQKYQFDDQGKPAGRTFYRFSDTRAWLFSGPTWSS